RQVEESREDIAPLRGPSDGFDPQRMKGEEEGRKRGGTSQLQMAAVTWIRQDQPQDPKDYEVEDDRICGVQEKIAQVVAEGVHAPEQVVQPEGHPGQRNPVAHVKRGPHPAELGPAEPAVARVVEE